MYFCAVNVNSRVMICALSTHWQQASKLTALPCHEHIIEYGVFRRAKSVKSSSLSNPLPFMSLFCHCISFIKFIMDSLTVTQALSLSLSISAVQRACFSKYRVMRCYVSGHSHWHQQVTNLSELLMLNPGISQVSHILWIKTNSSFSSRSST